MGGEQLAGIGGPAGRCPTRATTRRSAEAARAMPTRKNRAMVSARSRRARLRYHSISLWLICGGFIIDPPERRRRARGGRYEARGSPNDRPWASVPAVAHGAADLGAREADVLEHLVAHEHQRPRVAPDADFVRNGARATRCDGAEPG